MWKREEMSASVCDGIKPSPVSLKDVQEIVGGLVASVLWVTIIDILTNTTEPLWDAVSYVNMATDGIIGNSKLIAPFAYRPAVPVIVHAISNAFSIPITTGFQIMARVSAVGELFMTFVLARACRAGFGGAMVVMGAIALSYFHVKFPLFFYTLVDVEAYPIMILAIWALFKKKFSLCLCVSCLGLFFKEFLIIPPILLTLTFFKTYRQEASKGNLLWILITVVLTLCCIVIPRMFIPTHQSYQYIDPINHAKDRIWINVLRKIISAPAQLNRQINIFFSWISYWMPVILLTTPTRLRRTWYELAEYRSFLFVYLCLVLLLAMYGGTNTMIFVTYSLVAQIVLLSVLLRRDMALLEVIFMLIATLIYNRILLTIPTPSEGFERYIDFYGGWGLRVSVSTATRFLELVSYVLFAMALRTFVLPHYRTKQIDPAREQTHPEQPQ